MSLTTRFHQTTTIKIPNDIWKLIIDKIEPEPYKLPEFIIINDRCLKTIYMTEIAGPYTYSENNDNNYSSFYVYFSKESNIKSEELRSTRNPKLYKMFNDMIDYYKQYCLK